MILRSSGVRCPQDEWLIFKTLNRIYVLTPAKMGLAQE